MNTQNFKLDNTTIVQIVRLLQLGMLTGTDIVDQLRTLELSVSPETNALVPSPDYVEIFDENLNKMTEMAESAKTTE